MTVCYIWPDSYFFYENVCGETFRLATKYSVCGEVSNMKFEAITIKDISKALGLSVSTVSKALRGSHEISQETKKNVLEYARTNNYKPNPIAQSLKRGRSKSIGVIVCNIDNNFFSQAINGTESVARQKDYNVIITQSRESYERQKLPIANICLPGLSMDSSSRFPRKRNVSIILSI